MFVTYPSIMGMRKSIDSTSKTAKLCSGNRNGTVLAQTSPDQYRRRAEDFYSRSFVCRIDTTDFWVSDGTLESSLHNQHW